MRDRDQRLVEVIDGDAELGGELGIGGRALQRVLQLRVGALEFARTGAHAARNPVHRAQLVDDGALDAHDGVGLELDLAREVEPLDGGYQPDHAVGDEVGLLDVGRQTGGGAAGYILDQR